MLAKKLGNLKETHPEQRIEEDRQDRDHEQRSAVAELIPQLTAKNQANILPLHQSLPAEGGLRVGRLRLLDEIEKKFFHFAALDASRCPSP